MSLGSFSRVRARRTYREDDTGSIAPNNTIEGFTEFLAPTPPASCPPWYGSVDRHARLPRAYPSFVPCCRSGPESPRRASRPANSSLGESESGRQENTGEVARKRRPRRQDPFRWPGEFGSPH